MVVLENTRERSQHGRLHAVFLLSLANSPAGTEGLTEAELTGLVTRDSMIGTGLLHRRP